MTSHALVLLYDWPQLGPLKIPLMSRRPLQLTVRLPKSRPCFLSCLAARSHPGVARANVLHGGKGAELRPLAKDPGGFYGRLKWGLKSTRRCPDNARAVSVVRRWWNLAEVRDKGGVVQSVQLERACVYLAARADGVGGT